MELKKGIQVKIIAGKDKGKTGEILEINRKLSTVKIKSINMIKKHLKPTKENKGGIISKESFIHQSNVKNIDQKKPQIVLELIAIDYMKNKEDYEINLIFKNNAHISLTAETIEVRLEDQNEIIDKWKY